MKCLPGFHRSPTEVFALCPGGGRAAVSLHGNVSASGLHASMRNQSKQWGTNWDNLLWLLVTQEIFGTGELKAADDAKGSDKLCNSGS